MTKTNLKRGNETAFTADCLQDIAHFMGQLQKPE